MAKKYYDDLKKTRTWARKINDFLIHEEIPAIRFDIITNGTDILIKIDWEKTTLDQTSMGK